MVELSPGGKDQNLVKTIQNNGISESEFNEVIATLEMIYQPLVDSHAAVLRLDSDWTSSSFKTGFQRQGDLWSIQLYGGLAKASWNDQRCIHSVSLPRAGSSSHWLSSARLEGLWGAGGLFCGAIVHEAGLEVSDSVSRKYELADSKIEEICVSAWIHQDDSDRCIWTIQAGKRLMEIMARGNPMPLRLRTERS